MNKILLAITTLSLLILSNCNMDDQTKNRILISRYKINKECKINNDSVKSHMLLIAGNKDKFKFSASNVNRLEELSPLYKLGSEYEHWLNYADYDFDMNYNGSCTFNLPSDANQRITFTLTFEGQSLLP